MRAYRLPRTKFTYFVYLLLAVLGFVFISLLTYRVVSGRSLGIRSYLSLQLGKVKTVLGSSAVKRTSRGEFTNVIFLHHSVGHHLIEQGGVRPLFQQAGIDFWDHGYNWAGLNDPRGWPTGYNYAVPQDNTDPDGLVRIFRQPELGIPLNTFSGLLQHEVIAFKSCFPASNISSETQLEQYKTWYLEMRAVMDRHPEKLFIVLTPPPLNPAETTPTAAERARRFAGWLSSPEFLDGRPNIATFDFFDLLAESDPGKEDFNMLRADYREGTDSHPNQLANQEIGPQFVAFILRAIEAYKITLAGE